MGFFDILLLSPGQIIDLINSSWFFVWAVPIFFPLESAITYFYLKKLKTYKSIAEKKNILTTSWAYFSIKLFFALLGYQGAWLDIEMGRPLDISAKYMIFYYLYSLGVCAAFVAYLYNGHLPFRLNKRQDDQPEIPPEEHFEGHVIVDLGDSFQAMTEDMPPCAGRTMGGMVVSIILMNVAVIAMIIFLICGGLDDYFGPNKTADYHELGRTIDTVFYGFKIVFIGFIIAVAIAISVVVLHRNHKSFSSAPLPLNPDAPPTDPAPEREADQQPPPAQAPPARRVDD